jgi:hypothetical protein
MHRQPNRAQPELDALLDERDHLQILISLAAESPDANADKLEVLFRRVAQIENQIARHQRSSLM